MSKHLTSTGAKALAEMVAAKAIRPNRFDPRDYSLATLRALEHQGYIEPVVKGGSSVHGGQYTVKDGCFITQSGMLALADWIEKHS